MSKIQVPVLPGRPRWDEGDSAMLRTTLVTPFGQRFLAALFFGRPVVVSRAGEERRIQQDERTGYEKAIEDILALADPQEIPQNIPQSQEAKS